MLTLDPGSSREKGKITRWEGERWHRYHKSFPFVAAHVDVTSVRLRNLQSTNQMARAGFPASPVHNLVTLSCCFCPVTGGNRY